MGVVKTLEVVKQLQGFCRELGWEAGGLTAWTTWSLSSTCK